MISGPQLLGRLLRLPLREPYEALQGMRSLIEGEEGRRLYASRAGVDSCALNLSRLADWLEGVPRTPTGVSRFARLAA